MREIALFDNKLPRPFHLAEAVVVILGNVEFEERVGSICGYLRITRLGGHFNHIGFFDIGNRQQGRADFFTHLVQQRLRLQHFDLRVHALLLGHLEKGGEGITGIHRVHVVRGAFDQQFGAGFVDIFRHKGLGNAENADQHKGLQNHGAAAAQDGEVFLHRMSGKV